jgi:hypothetical protein
MKVKKPARSLATVFDHYPQSFANLEKRPGKMA